MTPLINHNLQPENTSTVIILDKETCLDEFQLMSYNYFIPASREYSFEKYLVFWQSEKNFFFQWRCNLCCSLPPWHQAGGLIKKTYHRVVVPAHTHPVRCSHNITRDWFDVICVEIAMRIQNDTRRMMRRWQNQMWMKLKL